MPVAPQPGYPSLQPMVEDYVYPTAQAVSSNARTGLGICFLLVISLTLLSTLCLSTGCGYSLDPTERAASSSITRTEEASGQTPGTPVVDSTPSAPPKSGVVEAGPGAPASLNPLIPANEASRRVTTNLFDSLLKVNAEDASLIPALASEWEVSEDCITTTFRIRPGVTWHDGERFTAADVAFTYGAIVDSGDRSPYASSLIAVDTFYAFDEDTLVVAFERPDCSLVYDVGRIPILPQHLIGSEEDIRPADVLTAPVYSSSPVGTGPFKFVSMNVDGEVRLERNDAYYAGAPGLAEWVYEPLGDSGELLAGLQAGKLDVAHVDSEQARQLQSEDMVDLVVSPRPEYYFLALNISDPLLRDRKTRRALSFAIDRQRMVQDLLDGFGQVIDSSWLPDHWAYSEPASFPDYDPGRAQQLFREAGWSDTNHDGLLDRDGQPLQVSISVNVENDLRKQIALAVQRYWMEAGVSAEMHFVEFNTLLEQLFSNTFSAAVFSWPVHPDPDQGLLWASEDSDLNGAFNFVSYSNPVVDSALAQGLAAPFCARDARSRAYGRAISAVAQDQPYIFLFVPQDVIAVNSRLSGIRPGPYSDLSWNVQEWKLDG